MIEPHPFTSTYNISILLHYKRRIASRSSLFALIAFGHRGGAAAPSSASPPPHLRATASRAAREAGPGPIVPRTLRSEASTIPPKCLGALADAADEDGELDRESYFAVADAVSNGYYSSEGMTSYGDLPFLVKYGFVTLSCRCLSSGGAEDCCTGDRARIDVDGIDAGLEGMDEELVAHVADVCGVIRDNVGDNILPEAPSSSPPPTRSPSATPTENPTMDPTTGSSGTPKGSPASLSPATGSAGPSAAPTTIPATSPPATDVETTRNLPTVGKASRGDMIAVSQKCLNALSASAENGKLGKENYFVFTDAMSNSYYSFNGMDEYGDLPFENKFGFVTLSCRCHAMGGREECCQGDRARIVVEGIDAEDPGSMPGELAEYVADICGVTRDSIGENIRPPTGEPPTMAPAGSDRPSGSPSSRPSMTQTRSPTAGPATRPSVTPTRSPTAGPTANPTTPLPTTAKPITSSPTNGTNHPTTDALTTNPPTTNPPATNPPTTNPPATNHPTTNPPAANPPTTNPPTTNPTLSPIAESPTNVPPSTDRPTDEVSLVYDINLNEATPSPTAAVVPSAPDFDGDRKGRGGGGDDGLPAGAWIGIAVAVGLVVVLVVVLMVYLLVKRERQQGPHQDEGLEATPGVKGSFSAAIGGGTSDGRTRPDDANAMTASEVSSVGSVTTSEHGVQEAAAPLPQDNAFLPGRLEGEGVRRPSSIEDPGYIGDLEYALDFRAGSGDSCDGSLDLAVESRNCGAVSPSAATVVIKNTNPRSSRTTQDVNTAVVVRGMAEV